MSFLAPEFTRLRTGQVPMTKPKTIINQKNLYQTLSAEELLVHPKRQILLKKIKRDSYIEEPHFSAFYHTLITRYVEFVQALPSQTGGKLGGLMDDALERALFAVQFTNASPDPLRKYAFFSAALLVDVGRAMGLHKVIISDEEGAFIEEWEPLKGSMLAKAKYYKLRPLGDQWTTLSQQVVLFFARQLVPEEAFKWLSEDYAVFQMWLATLLGDGVHGGELADFLFQVNERRNTELKKEYLPGQELPALDVPMTQPEQTAVGEDFLAFLNEGVEKGTLAAEDLQLLDSGELFVDAKVVQRFCEIYSKAVNLGVVVKQINSLGFHKLSGDDYRFEQFFSQVQDRPTKPALFFNANAPAQAFVPGMPVHLGAGAREGLRVQNPELFIQQLQSLPKSDLQSGAATKAAVNSMPEQAPSNAGLWTGKK